MATVALNIQEIHHTPNNSIWDAWTYFWNWPTFPWKQIKHSIRFVLSSLLLIIGPLTSHKHLVVYCVYILI